MYVRFPELLPTLLLTSQVLGSQFKDHQPALERTSLPHIPCCGGSHHIVEELKEARKGTWG
uniref:Adipogenesis associated Mth938 domain containing n=1 Tax=Mus musculus TaxID=10090 RepID=D6RJK8_MOUSE